MAIPQVFLAASDSTQWRFGYLSLGLFTALLESISLTILSRSARVHSSSLSLFEILLVQALCKFPYAELKKFKTFLQQVGDVKAAA